MLRALIGAPQEAHSESIHAAQLAAALVNTHKRALATPGCADLAQGFLLGFMRFGVVAALFDCPSTARLQRRASFTSGPAARTGLNGG